MATVAPLTVSLAPDIVLAPGYTLRVTALDPDDGTENTDVVISDVALQVNSLGSDLTPGDFEDLRPIYLQQNDPDYAGTASA